MDTPIPPVTFRESNRRYRRVFIPVMMVYCVLCFVGPGVMVAFWPSPPVWIMGPVAVLTGAPIAGVFWLLGRYLRETDEYTRKIQTEALLTGGAITLSVAVIWSFLELYRVVPRSEFFPAMMMVGPSFFMFYGLASVVQHKLRGGRLRELKGMGIGQEAR